VGGDSTHSTWPLVGRSDELAYAQAALASGEVSGVVLAGHPGVGKSRLAHELVSSVWDSDTRVVSCVATRATASIPFGAVAELLGTFDAALDDQLAVLRAVTSSLASPSDRKVLITLDDAHLVDDATAALLHHVVNRRLAQVVVTVRSGEALPEAITAMWKDGHCVRIDVQALARTETAELASAALGGPVGGPTLSRLWNLSRGNPMFLRELVLQAVEDGSLVEHMGYWRWTGDVQPRERLIDVVRSGMGRLAADDRHVITLVAFGEPLELDSLERLADHGAIARLMHRGVIESNVDGSSCTVSLGHPLYGEVIRADTSAIEARNVMRQLAEAMLDSPRRAAVDAGRLGRWAIDLGMTIDSVVLQQAAREAYLAGDFGLAARLAQSDPEWRVGPSGYILGSALARLEREAEAVDVLEQAAANPPSEELRGRIAYARMHILATRLGMPAEAERVYAEAMETVSDPVWRDLLTVGWTPMLVVAGRRDEADALLKPLVDSEHHRIQVAALRGLAYLLTPAGRTDTLIELCDQRLAQAFALRDDWEPGLYDTLAARTTALLMAGRLDEASGVLDLGDSVNADLDPVASSFLAAGRARVALFRGKPATAAALLQEAVAGFSKLIGVRGSWTLRLLAEALALLGDVSGAEAALASAEASDGVGQEVLARDGTRGAAWVAVGAGGVGQALTLLDVEAEVAHRLGEFGYESMILHDTVRLGRARAAAPRLVELAEIVDGPAVSAYAAHAVALAAGNGVGLDEASGIFERLGFLLLAAEAATEAAHAHRDHGFGSQAAASASRAERLRGLCEGAVTPALTLDRSVLALTPREHEIAMLAARGLSSRDIGTNLALSSRTVDNHLQRAYEKLGIRRREELALVLDVH